MKTITSTRDSAVEKLDKPRVLVVDDDRVNVRLLEQILHSDNFETCSARNGIDAISIARSIHPDLILLDIMMPEMDGFEACEILRADKETADVPIIFLSAMTGVNSKVRGLECGAVDYITKPFNRDEVIARARAHIKRSRTNKRNLQERDSRLQQVHEAQQQMLVRPDAFPDANFAVKYCSVCEAGGDFYDVVKLDNGVWGYLVADVSGHDIGASFATPALKAIFREKANIDENPDLTLKKINQALKPLMVGDEYMTACYMILDRIKMKVRLANAAHPPLLYCDADCNCKLLKGEGDVLGPFDKITVSSAEFEVKKGERLFLFTDGLVERFDLFCCSRLEAIDKLCSVCCTCRKSQLQDAVVEICKKMSSNLGPLEDDVVLLGVEV